MIDPFIFFESNDIIAIPARFKLPQKQVTSQEQPKPEPQKEEPPKEDSEVNKIIQEIKARL